MILFLKSWKFHAYIFTKTHPPPCEISKPQRNKWGRQSVPSKALLVTTHSSTRESLPYLLSPSRWLRLQTSIQPQRKKEGAFDLIRRTQTSAMGARNRTLGIAAWMNKLPMFLGETKAIKSVNRRSSCQASPWNRRSIRSQFRNPSFPLGISRVARVLLCMRIGVA